VAVGEVGEHVDVLNDALFLVVSFPNQVVVLDRGGLLLLQGEQRFDDRKEKQSSKEGSDARRLEYEIEFHLPIHHSRRLRR
jgi:hypothetical protein